MKSPNPVQNDILSKEEIEVLRYLTEGKTTIEISTHLGLTHQTVEKTRERIMEKLQLFTLAELTKYAIQHGVTSINN